MLHLHHCLQGRMGSKPSLYPIKHLPYYLIFTEYALERIIACFTFLVHTCSPMLGYISKSLAICIDIIPLKSWIFLSCNIEVDQPGWNANNEESRYQHQHVHHGQHKEEERGGRGPDIMAHHEGTQNVPLGNSKQERLLTENVYNSTDKPQGHSWYLRFICASLVFIRSLPEFKN